MNNRTIIFSDGQKGGVGKSMTAITLADYLMRHSSAIGVIDADHTNPDLARLFNRNIENVFTATYDFSELDDWMLFLESLEKLPQDIQNIIVSLPATLNINPYLDTACAVLDALNFDIACFFTLNRQADSVNLLSSSMETGLLSRSSTRVAVLNGLFGNEDKFDRWVDSDTKAKFESDGGSTAYLPELFYRSVDLCLVELQLPFSIAIQQEMPLVYRAQIQQWLRQTDSLYEKALGLEAH